MNKKFKSLQQWSQNRFFWIAQVLLFLICTSFAVYFYPKAFPIQELDIKMDRVSALKAASELAQRSHWGPSEFRQAAAFDTDSQTQTFVELSAGGSQAFAQLLKDKLYSPYTWVVRHFAEGQSNETLIRFTPQGNFYGFREELSENAPGDALSVEEALKIAEQAAKEKWSVPLSDFRLIEKSQEKQPSHRIDHTFVYERAKEKIGEGRYRLKLVVSGNRLTELSHFIKIPEAFLRHYAEMRSSNNTISQISSIAMVLLYLFGGCGLGVFFLLRKRWVIWKTPALFAAIVAGFQFLEQLNQLPLAWMSYDTALASSGFILKSLVFAGINFFAEFILLTVSFIGAESLSRKAFPEHPQFWRIWRPNNASSTAILGRTIGGYLSVGFFFAFVVLIYFVGTHYLGWWSPSDTLFHPDGLATYFPWFTSISNSLHAGFWEECLFRAVPLAGAALIGEKFGHRKKWLVFGFLLQALIFGAGHANYPAQPSYARVIELIIPSFVFGGFYLVYGLLPGIILHFTFDVVSFSLPLFFAQTPGIWIDRLLVVLFTLIPMGIVLFFRIKNGQWTHLSAKELNQGWTPPPAQATVVKKQKPEKAIQWNRSALTFLWGAGALSLLMWVFVFNFKNNALPLEVSREQAIEFSKKALQAKGIHLSPAWKALAHTASGSGIENLFIWRSEGPQRYQQLMGNYLMPPSWMVRFVRFDTNVEERAEEFQVFIAKKGEIIQIRHELPEARSGASLGEAKARQIALAAIEKDYGIPKDKLKEASSNASKFIARKDWLFIFTDSSIPLKSGEARVGVRIAGDQVASTKRFIFVPEDWSRSYRNQENLLSLIRIISGAPFLLILLGGFIYSIIHWTKKKFDSNAFSVTFSVFSILGGIDLLNGLPAHFSQLSTVEPISHQILELVTLSLVKILFSATLLACLVGYLHSLTQSKSTNAKFLNSFSAYWIGILLTVILAIPSRFLPSLSPASGSLTGLNDYIPQLMGLQSIEKLAGVSLLLSLIGLLAERLTIGWTQRKGLGLCFLFLLGFAGGGLFTEGFQSWILQGILCGICFTALFRYVIRGHSLPSIPMIVASVLILAELRQILLRPYPGMMLNGAISILLLLGASWYWHRSIYAKPALSE